MTRVTPRPSKPNSRDRVILPRPISSNLHMAELCLQRGDVEQAKVLLESRIGQGVSDFKTLNLYGVALAHGRHYDNAITIFRRLGGHARLAAERTRASFNLGLVLFYQDLGKVGDLSVAKTTMSLPGRTVLPGENQTRPFLSAIDEWANLLTTRAKYGNILHSYIAFACLQLAQIDQALKHLAAALSANESFYVTQYVLGRVFLDLFLLSMEGNDFALSKETLTFFEIEPYEMGPEKDGRAVVGRETLLDIGLQAFVDARGLSPLSPCVYLGLSEVYLYAGLLEEAQEALAHAETLAPHALATLEASLHFHEVIRSGPDVIRSLLDRIKLARRREPAEVYNVLPSYYLF